MMTGYFVAKWSSVVKELQEDPEWIESGFDPDDAFIQIHMFSCLHCGKHLFYIDQFFD